MKGLDGEKVCGYRYSTKQKGFGVLKKTVASSVEEPDPHEADLGAEIRRIRKKVL